MSTSAARSLPSKRALRASAPSTMHLEFGASKYVAVSRHRPARVERVEHEAVSDLCGGGAAARRVPSAVRHYLYVGLLDSDRLWRNKKALRGFRQDAAIQLSVRHPARPDDGGGRRYPLPRRTHWTGRADADRRCTCLLRRGAPLWLARPGERRASIHPVRPGRFCSRDDFVVAIP